MSSRRIPDPGSLIAGITFAGVGLIFLVGKVDLADRARWVWPIVLVGLGAGLLAAIGAWLGWPALLPIVLLSAIQGAIVGSILLVTRREPEPSPPPAPPPPAGDDDWVPPKHAVPYGPFLSLAALEYMFFGDRLVSGWNHFLFRLLS